MENSILTARIDSLEHLLERAKTSWWKENVELQYSDIPEELWMGLEHSILVDVQTQLETVKDVRKMLEKASDKQDLQDVWTKYSEVYTGSRVIFRECLESIGGLALRDRDVSLDKTNWQLADELIRHCAATIRHPPSLTIPAQQEGLSRTLGRIIRLPFPEWSIWALPFIAHEYGHVVLNEVEALSSFIRQIVERLPAEDPHLQALPDDRARRRARYHLEEIMADAFATYTMGPAYACAAILLRLNPSSADEEDDEHPTDAKRAGTVLTTLGLMNDPDDARLTQVIGSLESKWSDMVSSARPLGALNASDDAQKLMLGKIWGELHRRFPSARHLHTHSEEGLKKADEWCNKWLQELRKGEEVLTVPEPLPTDKLRDALNAAWLCRLEEPRKTGQIAQAVQGLCEAIIKAQREAIIDAQRNASRGSRRLGRGRKS